MKPKLKGDLPELFAAKVTLRRETKTGRYVEFVGRYEYSPVPKAGGGVEYVRQPSYYIGICGITARGVECAAYFVPGKDAAYIWQFADAKAVNQIMDEPATVYDFRCVKNGIRRAL